MKQNAGYQTKHHQHHQPPARTIVWLGEDDASIDQAAESLPLTLINSLTTF